MLETSKENLVPGSFEIVRKPGAKAAAGGVLQKAVFLKIWQI